MPITAIKTLTERIALNSGNPGSFSGAAADVKLGNVLGLVQAKLTFSSGQTSFDLTSQAVKAAITTVAGIDVPSNPTGDPSFSPLPPAGRFLSFAVLTGTNTGAYIQSDTGGTALIPGTTYPGVFKLSDDGKTVTIPSSATVVSFTYQPQVAISVETAQPIGAPAA